MILPLIFVSFNSINVSVTSNNVKNNNNLEISSFTQYS